MPITDLSVLIESWLGGFMLILARVSGFMHIGPVFSHANINSLVRFTLSFAVTLIISPLVIFPPKNSPLEYNFFLSLLLNLLIGSLIGFLTRLVLDIGQVAGQIADNQLGLSAASLVDPVTRQSIPILGQFFLNFSIALFLNIGGLPLVLGTFVKSFQYFPLRATQFIDFSFSPDYFIEATSKIWALGIIAASPVLVVLVFMDIVLSLISRAAPNVKPSDLSFSLKPIVGVLIILFMAPFFYGQVVKIFLEGVRIFEG